LIARPDWLTDNAVHRMERAHVRAWPALQTRTVDGWLCRRSGGGSQRANSVSAIEFTGTDPDAALVRAETLYRSWNAPARFHTYDLTKPEDLASRLQGRGYDFGETTVTMFKVPVSATAEDRGVTLADRPDGEWMGVYLDAITESRRAVNMLILGSIPSPRVFFTFRSEGHAISTALCVAGFGCAVIECVATRAEARRQGGAERVVRAAEDWAARQDIGLIGLQVVETNHPAVRLYRRMGFLSGATNMFWVQPRHRAGDSNPDAIISRRG
jgi:N-acetylglutamate synthase